jgi:hypothetical protein
MRVEVGFREQTATTYGFIDLWRRTFSGVPFQQFTATGTQITAPTAPPLTAWTFKDVGSRFRT